MLELHTNAEHSPALPILVSIGMATDELLEQEDIESFELDWEAVDRDAGVAVAARKMTTRRHHWAVEYDRLIGIVRRQLVGGFMAFVEALPESCFDRWETPDEAAFTVPLASLLDRPAETIERLILALYDDDVFRYDLFLRTRERLATNLLVASGFPPDTNIHEVSARLVMPTVHKSRDATALVELYLAGTPFADLLRLPVPFYVPDAMRFEHCHIVGGTGHGKTQLIQRLIFPRIDGHR